MFTGLVQAVGRLQRRSSGLVVSGCEPFAPLTVGDSVAVDGVCLTVADLCGDGFRADVSEETLSRTTLGSKADRGAEVNLEPALRLSDRLGGHLVSGHIDATGTCSPSPRPSPGNSRWVGRMSVLVATSAKRPASPGWRQPHGGPLFDDGTFCAGGDSPHLASHHWVTQPLEIWSTSRRTSWLATRSVCSRWITWSRVRPMGTCPNHG